MELNKDENSHLAVILNDLGPAPAQLPRKENRAINFPLFSKWETAIDDLTAALDITQEEVTLWKQNPPLCRSCVLYRQIVLLLEDHFGLERVADAAATSRNDAVMVRKVFEQWNCLANYKNFR
jgi:Ras GTPase-activating-like protein IQGAP2/3